MTLLIALVALNLLVNLVCGIVLITRFWTGTDEYNEPQPEGAMAQVEHSHSFTAMPEMHANYRGTELEEDGGAYRIGFRGNK
ncbi:hypothetical protein MOMMJLID_CDS0065 [Arthrobacter phage 1191A]|nr:hypothetical protein MOMMJLID_CDS0065 [Arthrobacter phage 1191A]